MNLDGLPKKLTVLVSLLLLAAPILPLGCTSLCTKRLYLYRDTEQKSLPPADMALLLSDPAMVSELFPEAASQVRGKLPWAPEQAAYDSDAYRLSIDSLDGRPVFQGLCMDITLTSACEVRPGSRRVTARVDLVGPWGRESIRDNVALTLAPGGVYFLRPDWGELADKRFRVHVERLSASYTSELRGRLLNWLRRHTTGRSLD